METGKAKIWLLLLLLFTRAADAKTIQVGDIEINPGDFSAEQDPEKRIAPCLACHGNQAGGDRDFGPEVQFGTPALQGMTEAYLKESLVAYKTGARVNDEMRVISTMLDEDIMNFMARSFATFQIPPMLTADELEALASQDSLFRTGQMIARRGISQKGVAACTSCHGLLGEGSAIAPRLAGQNVMYIENQFRAFSSGTRQSPQSALMQVIAAGLSDDDIKAVAHYYESILVRNK